MHAGTLSTILFRFQLTNGHSEVTAEVTASGGPTTGDQKTPIIIRRVSYGPVPGKSVSHLPTHVQQMQLVQSVIRLNLRCISICLWSTDHHVC